MTSSNFQQLLDLNDSAQEVTQALQSADTQTSQDAAIQILTQICQRELTSIIQFGEGTNPFLAIATQQAQQSAAQGIVNGCTELATWDVNFWNAYVAASQATVEMLLAATSPNPTQSADFTALQDDVTSGDSADAVTAANQFVADEGFVGTANDNGSVTYEQDVDDETVYTTVTSDWAPVSYIGTNGNTYYFVQPDDIGETDSDTWDNIATDIGNLNSFSISGSELARLENAVGGEASVGGLIYVPTASESVDATPNSLSDLPTGQTYIYDSGNDTAYAAGSSLDGSNAGGLFVLDTDGNATVFAPGTWQNVADSGDDSSTVVNLQDADSDNIGSLSIDKSTGTVTLTAGSGSPATETFSDIDTNPVFVIQEADGSDLVGQLNGDAYKLNTDGTISTAINPFPDGGSLTDGAFTAALVNQFSTSQSCDPIVLDLSGDDAGVQLTSLADSDAYFDLYDTDYAVHTGWVGPTTGILVNTTDPTNITDLFGNSSTNGFVALQALDVYDAGVLNSSDPGWSSLYVWVDANGNGEVDPGEVESLSDLGITSINLEATPVNEVVNGNEIGEVATFTYSDDSTGQVAEAFFNNTSLDTYIYARRAANDNADRRVSRAMKRAA